MISAIGREKLLQLLIRGGFYSPMFPKSISVHEALAPSGAEYVWSLATKFLGQLEEIRSRSSLLLKALIKVKGEM
jgi:hypothetical protein